MQQQLIRHGQGSRTWSIVLDSGEEVNACLEDFARRELLSATSFTASGTLQDAVLGYLDAEKHAYHPRQVAHPTQVLSLVGDIALRNGKPHIRMRAVLGGSDGNTFDGHLLEGHVRKQMEVIMTEAPVQLHKGYDADAGLALFKQQHGEMG
ncbi:PPC domain-containing DNA-binding protein [Dyella sp.]|uniref:PPC domain-containing DNA-binding protein n=1 Tax=Dyella sp. TaxID=1869338 RepID=UPI002B4867AB|nr:DUF296 domain-containing protein [Dyella sp.]HKT30791.1 DUF296 domain-containing protein [Dyella sp.]